MSGEPIPHVVDNLVGCALSLCAFHVVEDLNTRLALLQQINKEYSALSNKLESRNISTNDLDIAAVAAKGKLPSEIDRRDDFELSKDASEKLSQTCPSKVDQLVNFLKQKRIVQINVSLSFKEPED